MDQKRPSQEHRLKRTALWATLWLTKLIWVLPAFERIAPAAARAWLDRRLTFLARFALHLIGIRAAQFRHIMPAHAVRDVNSVMRALRRHDVRVNTTHSMRAALGGRLRRTLKARGFKARAEAILEALLMRDELAARLARRLRKGLSRQMSAHSKVKPTSLPLHRPAGGASSQTAFGQISFGEELRAGIAPP